MVLHPDYRPGENQLIRLPANDDGGIHYDTALVACQILANNRWDGYLARKTAAPAAAPAFERVVRPADGRAPRARTLLLPAAPGAFHTLGCRTSGGTWI